MSISRLGLVRFLLKTKFSGFLYTEEDVKIAFLNLFSSNESTDIDRIDIDCNYYQELHENDEKFQNNNWLVSEINNIIKVSPEVVLELGCGNGAFSIEVAKLCNHVIAIDWAKSPRFTNLPDNVEFINRDILRLDLPTADVTCSADFLEHLPLDKLEFAIAKIVNSSRYGYHKIACYDDGHSHLSILSPWGWLELFKQFDKSYAIKGIEFRNGSLLRQVVTLANFDY